MELDALRKRSATLFNYIVFFVAVNILTFIGTAAYCGKLEQDITASGVEKSDPSAYAEQMGTMKVIAFSGFAVAIVAIICCVPFLLKRGKLMKQIAAAEAKALDDLDI